MSAFAKRVTKEILRDPLTLFFGLGFPIVILLLLTAIQTNIPVELFAIETLAPGVTVFGLAFITLFSAMLISKDRTASLLPRLCTTPLRALDFILGYTLPLVPISIVQALVTYAAAALLGLDITPNLITAILGIVPISLFYISLGLLCGSLLSDKQVGGICGALLTNLSAWLSGIWFDLDLVGGAFKKIAYALPFVHSVELERALVTGNYGDILPHLAVILTYTAVFGIISAVVFVNKMKKQ